MKKRAVIRDIVTVGLAVAFIEAAKFVMAGIPNVELTSFLLIMFALHFGKLIYFAIPVFILIEGAVYGFGLWWIMYLYAWPMLVIVTRLIGRKMSRYGLAMLSGAFGLGFGAMCALPYIFLGGFKAAFLYWVAGIPFDIVHGVSNFIIMMILYRPMARIMQSVSSK